MISVYLGSDDPRDGDYPERKLGDFESVAVAQPVNPLTAARVFDQDGKEVARIRKATAGCTIHTIRSDGAPSYPGYRVMTIR